MGWETRKGRRYFYETTYVDGERIRRCHGYSIDAFIAAQRVENERKERERDIANIRALQAQDRLIDQKIAQLETVVQIALSQSGYHYSRGQFRKRRHK